MNPILWQPSPERIADANITRFMAIIRSKYGADTVNYASLYQWSIEYPEHFWSAFWDFSGLVAQAKGETVLAHGERMPGAKWFPQARLNYAENLLRKRADDEFSVIFWGENRIKRRLTYGELYSEVSKLTQALRSDGVVAGDRVAGILPNLPETVIAMLAATSIGAVWTSCSPDFGVPGIKDRLGQIEPKILFVCDGYFFNGKAFDISERIEAVHRAIPSIEKIILVPYIDTNRIKPSGIIVRLDDYVAGFPGDRPIEFISVPFDHPLYIVYSSGTTGPPKCIVHSVGGTLIQHMKEHLLHVDCHPQDRLFYFTTCGWMMWNWLVSGLATETTLILYDGSPVYPETDALFQMVEDTRINIFGVSAKYIDLLKKSDSRPARLHDLSSLKSILSTGSPLAPENFDFVYHSIKSNLCLSSISGGTDIVSCFALGCPVLPVRRGEIQCRGLGMKVDVFDEQSHPLRDQKGELVCTAPFPSMPIKFWNDPDQHLYRSTYFEKFPNVWCHGDYVELTDNGGLIIYGRSDTVLNPGGVRIGTAEIYRQVEQIGEVLESLVIGQEWVGDLRIVLFVVLRKGIELSDTLVDRIRHQIRTNASPRHVPAKIIHVHDIPRTRSGKIVELVVADIVHGRPVKNRQALANPESLELFADISELTT